MNEQQLNQLINEKDDNVQPSNDRKEKTGESPLETAEYIAVGLSIGFILVSTFFYLWSKFNK